MHFQPKIKDKNKKHKSFKLIKINNKFKIIENIKLLIYEIFINLIKNIIMNYIHILYKIFIVLRNIII